jgi:hypothetical protein
MKNWLGLFIVTLYISGCASSYNMIMPPMLSYPNKSVSDSVSLYYCYKILEESDNRKYARKERKSGIKVVAVKIVNNSTRAVSFKNNLQLFAGSGLVLPKDNTLIYYDLKQSVPSYMVYLVLFPMHKITVNFGGPANVFPFGFVVAPLFAATNMIKAAHANNLFRFELDKFNIVNQDIPPGETVYGLMCIESEDEVPLTLKRRLP